MSEAITPQQDGFRAVALLFVGQPVRLSRGGACRAVRRDGSIAMTASIAF